MTVDLFQTDIYALKAALESGKLTSLRLVEAYIARIEDRDETTKSVICVNPYAREVAQKSDDTRQKGEIIGLLHGIPILIDDLYATHDMETTAGSLALQGANFAEEAAVVGKLRAAGAIILGKTNVSEWGNARRTDGWSAVRGRTLGAYSDTQHPGGSSCGSAVAVRLGFAAAAVGTELNMGLTSSAAKASLVGLKPTPGFVSRAGMVIGDAFQDGPVLITRTVDDAALLMTLLADIRSHDHLPKEVCPPSTTEFRAACRKDALQGVRVAVPRESLRQSSIDAPTRAVFKRALQILEDCGAQIIDHVKYDRWNWKWTDEHLHINRALLKRSMETMFSELKDNPNSLETLGDLIDYIKRTPEEEYDVYGATYLEKAWSESSRNYNLPECIIDRQSMGRDVRRLLAKYHCDVIAVPADCRNPSDLGQCPTITVPMGFYPRDTKPLHYAGRVEVGPNIPMGLMFIGVCFSEYHLLGYAYAFERAIKSALKKEDLPFIWPDPQPTSQKGPKNKGRKAAR